MVSPQAIKLENGKGMRHIYPIHGGFLSEADAAVVVNGRWIRERVT